MNEKLPDSSDEQASESFARRETNFRKELRQLLNCHSMENNSDTPDFILSSYLITCIAAFDGAVKARDRWHGFKPFRGLSEGTNEGCVYSPEDQKDPKE